ncbi:P-loop containing nucleoside triphosphate hydrolase protein [Flagelloscypha sp. PMI_526]|nr:P-loop containing nucleoside triphosphate hydrolase protein [Flagelloscypha sp. PMI_526]
MSVYRRKLVIVGDGAVGKTSLLIRYTCGKFPEKYLPGVFENYVADIQVDSQNLELALWDTAGQESYDRLRPLSYPGANVILLAFSIDNPDSLENVHEKWINEIQHFAPTVPFILVGCKKDLEEDEETVKDLARCYQRPTTFDEGLAIALKVGAGQYLECSAKTGEGVAEVFEVAARAAMEPPSRTHTDRRKRGPCVVL